MRIRTILLGATTLCWTASAAAQGVSVEELARRVEALERDNAALRAQIQQMAAPSAAAPAPQPPAAATPQPAPTFAQEPVEPWDGAYLGVNGGYARFRTVQDQSVSAIDRRVTTEGPSFGAQVGRRWQSGPVVSGLELEANFPLETDNVTFIKNSNLANPFPGLVHELTAHVRLKGSVGFSSGPFLAYGIAGLEVSHVRFRVRNFSIFSNPAVTTRTNEYFNPGFVFGLGAGYKLSDALSVEFEATRSPLGTIVNLTKARSDGVVLRLNQTIP